MKRIETKYNKYGWKKIVIKGKDIWQIYLRSKSGCHTIHKPFYLRLSDKDLEELLQIIKELRKGKGGKNDNKEN